MDPLYLAMLLQFSSKTSMIFATPPADEFNSLSSIQAKKEIFMPEMFDGRCLATFKTWTVLW